MMKKYKLIKKYPGSPKLGTEVIYSESNKIYNYNEGDFYTELPKNQVENLPEFWEEVVEKDYEILSFVHNGTNSVPKDYIVQLKDGKLISEHQKLTENHYLKSNCWSINSVKRIKDGEIFTVGDKVDCTISDLGRPTDITGFKIIDNKLKVGLRHLGYYPLSTIMIFKKPLLTTEDDVDIYEDERIDFVYKVNPSFEMFILSTFKFKINKNCKYFSTKKAAENYIKMHKPVLSYNEVLGIYDKMTLVLDILDRKEFKYQLEKLVKSKL